MGYNCIEELRKTRKLLDQFNLKAKIIAASTREILNVVEWFEAGAHIVTVVPNILEGMLIHPYTKETVQQFLRDALRSEKLAQRTPVSSVSEPMPPIGARKNNSVPATI